MLGNFSGITGHIPIRGDYDHHWLYCHCQRFVEAVDKRELEYAEKGTILPYVILQAQYLEIGQ